MIEQFVAPAHGVLPVSHLDIPVITHTTTGQLSQFSKAPVATPNMIATGGGGYGDFGDF